ncbi:MULTISPECIES: alpha/beta fold hydrolase [Corynebacterium]|uniref:alpha/beta fold hydrolase n=1 Tax=Corynebacterium TaxID=1716 RepID=UPI001CE420B0|nr:MULTISPECIES: alpha/beta hydrolase [Corynebacterium]
MPTSTFIHSRGVRLRVQVQGPRNAPLVLLIHGFGGGCFDWELVMDELAHAETSGVSNASGASSTSVVEPRVAAVDLRGYGESDKTPRGYDLTTAASDMAGVIRGLGYSKAIVVGHGFGGMVAWTLAAHEPERVAAVVTVASAHPLVQFRSLLVQPHKQWRRMRRTLAAQVPRYPETQIVKDNAAKAERIFRSGVAPGFRDTEIYNRFAGQRREAMLVDKVAHLSAEYQRWPFRSRLRPEGGVFERSFPARTAAPVLAIEGSMDPDYSPQVAERSVARSSNGRVELIYGVGHYPHIEDAPTVSDLILQHTQQHWDHPY